MLRRLTNIDVSLKEVEKWSRLPSTNNFIHHISMSFSKLMAYPCACLFTVVRSVMMNQE